MMDESLSKSRYSADLRRGLRLLDFVLELYSLFHCIAGIKKERGHSNLGVFSRNKATADTLVRGDQRSAKDGEEMTESHDL